MIRGDKELIEYTGEVINKNKKILCRCLNCGRIIEAFASSFYAGHIDCVCKHPYSSRLYSIWVNIKTRCYNPKSGSYQYYMKKGITMCQEWKDNYKTFESWALSSGYKDNLTIDRINNNLGYYPDNCRWATYDVQNKNKSSNINITIDGLTLNIKDWCRKLGIKYKTVMSYYYRHGKEAVTLYLKRKMINDEIKRLENDRG